MQLATSVFLSALYNKFDYNFVKSGANMRLNFFTAVTYAVAWSSLLSSEASGIQIQVLDDSVVEGMI